VLYLLIYHQWKWRRKEFEHDEGVEGSARPAAAQDYQQSA